MNVWSVNYVNQLLRTTVLLVSLVFVSTLALADEASDAKQLDEIYAFSGVHSHLSWVLSVVQQESKKAQLSCASQDELPDIKQSLVDILASDALRTSFVVQLKERITPALRNDIVTWMQSSAGQQVYKAEADSLQTDEEQFDAMNKAFQNSANNTDERKARMSEMLSDTGAVYFISALNTEISALVIGASVCSTSAEDLAKVDALIKEERGGESLYRAFMRQELLTPANVVYQKVSDEHIDAYIEFASTDAGKAYFTALIKGIRAVLSERSDELKLALEAL